MSKRTLKWLDSIWWLMCFKSNCKRQDACTKVVTGIFKVKACTRVSMWTSEIWLKPWTAYQFLSAAYFRWDHQLKRRVHVNRRAMRCIANEINCRGANEAWIWWLWNSSRWKYETGGRLHQMQFFPCNWKIRDKVIGVQFALKSTKLFHFEDGNTTHGWNFSNH